MITSPTTDAEYSPICGGVSGQIAPTSRPPYRSGIAMPGEMTSPAATVASTAVNTLMWVRMNASQSCHHAVSNHSVATNTAYRKQRNNAP